MSTSSLPPGDAEFNPQTKELTSKEKKELKKYIDTLIAHLEQYEEDEDLKAQAIRQFNRAWDNIKNYSAPKERSMRNLLRTFIGKARGPVKVELDAMWQQYEKQSRERKEQEHFNNHAASPFDSVPEYVWGINRPSTDLGGSVSGSQSGYYPGHPGSSSNAGYQSSTHSGSSGNSSTARRSYESSGGGISVGSARYSPTQRGF
ncbi:hypothetical protein R3P38DRAFT_335965 [Favolaschia claudopus]|uniref:Uncharacterized protein n=1 Tax=Favolaschia claudopus TaxID=2862362 RepID=A0AAV9ZL66_9AGAR